MANNDIETPRGRGIYLLPNLFTMTALFAGFYAIVAAMKGIFDDAAIAIFVAMLMDSLDGRIARLTNTETAFGAQLDSLSDMVCFGVAPALVIYSWSLSSLGKIGWLVAFIFAMAVALRLARFNTQLDKDDKRYFQGLSCTAGAGVIAGLVWLGNQLAIGGHSISLFTVIMTIATGLLMVSNVRYRSFKDFDPRGPVPFMAILVALLVLVLITLDPPKVLFATFFLYELSGPLTAFYCRYSKSATRPKINVEDAK